MKRSPKLPAFAGRCRAKHLTDAAAFAANEALEKAAFAPASRQADAMLTLLLLLLALAGLTQCSPGRKAAAQRHRDEHAAPMPGRYELHWADLDHD